MRIIIFFFQQMLLFTVPLIVAATGGMFCERSGIINIGLEGNMIMGAFCGALFLHAFPGMGQWSFLAALLSGAISGMMWSSLHAFASIKFNANQAISGIALNMAAPSLTIFIGRILNGKQQVTFLNDFRIESLPVFSRIPFIGDIFFRKFYVSLYIALALFVIGAIVINRTRFGMRVRACGDNPQAADSVGINVRRTRYLAVLICGAYTGMAGVMLVVPTSTEFNTSVAGYGFLAVSVIILGRWRPKGIMLASVLFGITKTFAAIYSAIPILAGLHLDAFIYRMIPFVVSLIVLSFSSDTRSEPLASGQPYDKGAR